jgi:hypothetical protein
VINVVKGVKMPSNSTSKMFHAFGVSVGVEEQDQKQNNTHTGLPSLKPPSPKPDMKHALTHALGFSADKNHTPMD